MTKPTQSGAPVENQDSLAEAVASLLREPFAVQNRLGYSGLQKVGESLEGDGASLGAKLRESFERCKGAYCQILMELEARGLAESSVTRLADLAKKSAPAPEAKAPAKPAAPAPEAKPPPKPAAPAPEPKAESKPAPPAPAKAAPPLPAFSEPTGPAAEFLRIAEFFQQSSNAPFPKAYQRRLMGQNFLFALEARCHQVLAEALPLFWPSREAAIERLTAEDETFELQPALAQELEQAAAARTEWLGESQFPAGAATMALRYLFSRPSADDFAPSLNEAATIFLFFANPGPLGEWPLGNELQVAGISQPEAVELAFQLYRMHRLRIDLLSPHRQPKTEDMDTLPRTIQRIFALLSKMHFGEQGNKAAA